MGVPHFGHFIWLHGWPAVCGTFSPQLGHTHSPPGPPARGPPILPPRPPAKPPPAPRPDAPPRPRPKPIPEPLGIVFLLWPIQRRRPPQPGMQNACLVSLPSRKAARTSSTGPQTNPNTRTPEETNAASSGAEIAPQIRTSAPSVRNSPARASTPVWVSTRSSRWRSRPLATSMSRTLPAASNTGETRPCQCAIATLIQRRGVHVVCRRRQATLPMGIPVGGCLGFLQNAGTSRQYASQNAMPGLPSQWKCSHPSSLSWTTST